MDIFSGINDWIEKKEQQMFDSVNATIVEHLTNLGIKIWEGLIYILPDVVGLGACAVGGFLMISPMIDQSPAKVLGWGAVGFIFATSILIAT